jgi:hypothetical protein
LPHPTQHPDESLVANVPGLLRKLAYGEVRLLLAGTPFAERYAPDLRHRRTQARMLRSASHLAELKLLNFHPSQEVFCFSANGHFGLLFCLLVILYVLRIFFQADHMVASSERTILATQKNDRDRQ